VTGDVAVPGVLVAWSGTQPMSRLFPLDHDVVLGRMLLGETDDDRLSREHVRITPRLGVTAIGRNATHLDGAALSQDAETPASPLSVLRAGRTVAVLVADVRRFALDVPSHHPDLVTGRRTAALHGELVAAARDGAHVVLTGGPGTGRRYLATTYGKMSPRPARVITDPFLDDEAAAALLDSLACSYDLRLVVTRNRFAMPLRPILDTFLKHHARWLEVPWLRERADEVAGIIQRVTARTAVACSGSVLEYCLLHTADNLSYLLGGVGAMTAARGNATAGADDLTRALRAHWVMVGPERRRG
jgi:hypothetical protein